MKIQRSVFSLAAIAAFGISALALSGAAQARELAWSIGVASPGVQLGMTNAPYMAYRQPVYVSQPAVVVAPQTVYYAQPRVEYSQPQVVYSQPLMVYGQPRVVYAPPPYYVRSGWAPPVPYRGWGPRHRWHDDRQDHDRRH